MKKRSYIQEELLAQELLRFHLRQWLDTLHPGIFFRFQAYDSRYDHNMIGGGKELQLSGLIRVAEEIVIRFSTAITLWELVGVLRGTHREVGLRSFFMSLPEKGLEEEGLDEFRLIVAYEYLPLRRAWEFYYASDFVSGTKVAGEVRKRIETIFAA